VQADLVQIGVTVIFGISFPSSKGIGQHVWTIGYEAQVNVLYLLFIDEVHKIAANLIICGC
jgi:hypothetical protein